MSFIPEGYGEVVVTYTQQGSTRPAQWTLGVKPGLTEDLATYGTDLAARYQLSDGPLDPTEFDSRLTAVNLRFTYQSDTGPVVYDTPLNILGSRTGDAQPPNVAVLIRRTTDRGGRRGRGRLYLPSAYINEVDVLEGGILAGARRTSLQDVANSIRTRAETAAGTVAVLLHNDNVVPPDELTALTVQPMVATMRRRLRK